MAVTGRTVVRAAVTAVHSLLCEVEGHLSVARQEEVVVTGIAEAAAEVAQVLQELVGYVES